ncbi:MAG: hypothetical protein PHC86_09005 [Eubacteriales bacterium]|nr:hypothetical protein [Eubacteriales bacterium]
MGSGVYFAIHIVDNLIGLIKNTSESAQLKYISNYTDENMALKRLFERKESKLFFLSSHSLGEDQKLRFFK